MTACLRDSSGDLHFHRITDRSRLDGSVSDGRPGSSQSQPLLWERFQPPQADLLRQLAEEQGRCSSDVASLNVRLQALEEQVMSTSERLELAAASSRMPMVISEGPSMSRLIANPNIEVSTAIVPVEDAQKGKGAGGGLTDLEASLLQKRIDEFEEAHSEDIAGLKDAIEATREGMARLARDLQIERNERAEVQLNLVQLAYLGPSLDRFQKTLKAELVEMIRESVSSSQAAVNSRVQLLLIELREEVQRTPRPLVEADQLGSCRGVARSLSEWLPQETDGNSAATKSMLMYLGVFDGMLDSVGSPDQLVARPNFRFVHRAVIAIKHATGYPSGVLEDWPEPYDAKLVFLSSVWDSVAVTLDLRDLEFDAEGVLKCTNRNGARRLLQLLAIAASKERGQQRRSHLPQLPAPP